MLRRSCYGNQVATRLCLRTTAPLLQFHEEASGAEAVKSIQASAITSHLIFTLFCTWLCTCQASVKEHHVYNQKNSEEWVRFRLVGSRGTGRLGRLAGRARGLADRVQGRICGLVAVFSQLCTPLSPHDRSHRSAGFISQDAHCQVTSEHRSSPNPPNLR